jgi:hypothetical protein
MTAVLTLEIYGKRNPSPASWSSLLASLGFFSLKIIDLIVVYCVHAKITIYLNF